MIETLRIQNYALIDDLEIEFASGFNVLTGETGAGKSIVAGALNLLLGARASSEVVRDGAEKAKVEALFRLSKPSRRLVELFKAHDITVTDNELIVSRTVAGDGRSRASICGNLVPIGVLAEIGDELVDLHGQHEHQSLLKAERQLELLDSFGGTEQDADAVADAVAAVRSLEREIASLESDDRERARKIEFMRFELAEIAAAALTPAEEQELRERRALITNAERIVESATRAYAALYENEESPAIADIGLALRELQGLASVDPRFAALEKQLDAVLADLEAVAGEIRLFTRGMEFDPQELDIVNTRLNTIAMLKRKYGDTIENVLAYAERVRADIAMFDKRDERLAELQSQYKKDSSEAMLLAESLSVKRKAAGKKLDKKVTATLQELGMKGALFETRVQSIALSLHGIDAVEFFLAANAGEKPKPLRQVASGGEISRIMLSLKAVFAGADKIPTLIFDEIDAGVGGSVANNVAEKLRQLAQSHQTICITHLPQIAAAADAHFHVSKASQKGRTFTTVKRVERETRVEEVARLLDGSVSAVSLEHARTLLKAK
jgi:DNA repair protein RecN (Recombination protein N)